MSPSGNSFEILQFIESDIIAFYNKFVHFRRPKQYVCIFEMMIPTGLFEKLIHVNVVRFHQKLEGNKIMFVLTTRIFHVQPASSSCQGCGHLK